MSWGLWIVGAYLLGGVPFSLLIVRAVAGVDVRQAGSGNPGATNTLRVAGRRAALGVLALDVAKGALPVWAAARFGAPAAVAAASGVAAVLGHVFPIYLRLRGGKGVATALGVFAALAPACALAATALFGLVLAWKRYVSLGSLILVVSVPVLMALPVRGLGPAPPSSQVAALLIAALVVVRHAGNVRRLLRGTERRLGEARGPR